MILWQFWVLISALLAIAAATSMENAPVGHWALRGCFLSACAAIGTGVHSWL